MSRFVIEDHDGDVDVDIVIEPMSAPLPMPGKLLFDSGAVWRAFATKDGFRIDCHSEIFGDVPYKVALLSRDLSSVRILIRFDVFNDEMHALDYPLDEVLIAHLLGRGRGVELHSCGIIDREGRGQLFVGQSGAGKSTTARVWLAEGDYEIVSDDRVIIRFVDGEWRMYGTPWHGEAALSSAASAPLAQSTFSCKRRERSSSHSRPRRRRKAFSCSFPPFYDAEALGMTLGILDRIVAEVPVRALRFVPDRSVLDCIQSAA